MAEPSEVGRKCGTTPTEHVEGHIIDAAAGGTYAANLFTPR